MSLRELEKCVKALDPMFRHRRRFGIILEAGRNLGRQSQREFAKSILAGRRPPPLKTFSQTAVSQMETGTRLPPSPAPEYDWLFDQLAETMGSRLELSSAYLREWLVYAAQVEHALHHLDSVVELREPFGQMLAEVCQSIVGRATPESLSEWRFGMEAASNSQAWVLYRILCTGWARAREHEGATGPHDGDPSDGRYWKTKGGETYSNETENQLRSLVDKGLDWDAVTRWAKAAYGADLADCFVHLGARLSLGGAGLPLKIEVGIDFPGAPPGKI